MEKRTSALIFLILLLTVQFCSAFRIPAAFGKFGRVPAVVKGDDELDAVTSLQYHTQHQHLHLVRPMRESRAAEGSYDRKACQGLNGLDLAHCQRQRFERFLTEDDYPVTQSNENEKLAPLPV